MKEFKLAARYSIINVENEFCGRNFNESLIIKLKILFRKLNMLNSLHVLFMRVVFAALEVVVVNLEFRCVLIAAVYKHACLWHKCKEQFNMHG